MHSRELLHNLYASPNIINDQMEQNEIGETCMTYERYEMHTEIFPENLMGREHHLKAYV